MIYVASQVANVTLTFKLQTACHQYSLLLHFFYLNKETRTTYIITGSAGNINDFSVSIFQTMWSHVAQLIRP